MPDPTAKGPVAGYRFIAAPESSNTSRINAKAMKFLEPHPLGHGRRKI
jgi:hypothetical protein